MYDINIKEKNISRNVEHLFQIKNCLKSREFIIYNNNNKNLFYRINSIPYNLLIVKEQYN